MDRLLPAPPRLPVLYATAVTHSARAALRRTRREATLPTNRHRLENVVADPEKVAGFQRLMGQAQPEFLPSGYVHTLAFPVAVSVLARADFPLPLLGMIHLRNEIHHRRPIPVGEPLSVTAWVENLRPHRSGTQVDVVVDVHGTSGPAWNGRSTYLAKGVHLASTAAAGVRAAATETERAPEELPAFPTREWMLDVDAGRRYAAVSGDYNPIHLSALTARALGMKRPIAHGMYLASRMVADAGPGETIPFRWTVDFRTPVTLPSRVFLSSRVEGSAKADWRSADVAAWDPRRRRTHFTGRLERLEESAGG
jgi:acyl dehydratase